MGGSVRQSNDWPLQTEGGGRQPARWRTARKFDHRAGRPATSTHIREAGVGQAEVVLKTPGARHAAAVLRKACREWLRGEDLSVALVADREMRALNRRWRGKDATTDVLSFPREERASPATGGGRRPEHICTRARGAGRRGHLAARGPPPGARGRVAALGRAAAPAGARPVALPRLQSRHGAGGEADGAGRAQAPGRLRPGGRLAGAEAGSHRPRFAVERAPWRPCHRNWTSSPGASKRSGGRFDIEKKRARVELIERESVQPGFWDDQKRAQALSKEKSDLELQLAPFERERQKLDDAVALYELAEEADDEVARGEAKAAPGRGARGRGAAGAVAHARRARRTGSTPSSTSTPARAAPSRRTGRRCCCACTRATASARAGRWSMVDFQPGEEAGIKSATFMVARRLRLRLAQGGDAACTGWCASRPSTPTRAATPPSPRSSSTPRSTTTSRSTSTRQGRAHRHLPRARARAARTSTRPTRPSA